MDPFDDPANDDAGGGFGIVPRHLRGHLTAYEIAVYVALTWRIDAAGVCWLRHKRLADESGCSLRTVQRALDGLKEKGLVDWQPRYGEDGSLLCNEYRLAMVRPSDRRDPPATLTEPPGLTGVPPRPVRPTEREPLNETPLTLLPPPDQPDPVDSFADWYARYPRKVGRANAERAYRRALKTASPEQLADGLARYLAEIDRKQTSRDYIKHPATWLNGACWDDQYAEVGSEEIEFPPWSPPPPDDPSIMDDPAAYSAYVARERERFKAEYIAKRRQRAAGGSAAVPAMSDRRGR
jgi:hypothetical protein